MIASAVDKYFQDNIGRGSNGDRAAGPAARGPVGTAAGFAAAVARFAAGGFKTVGAPLHALRVAQCQTCEHRRDAQCSLCRCFIDKKAWLPHEDCPIGRWPA